MNAPANIQTPDLTLDPTELRNALAVLKTALGMSWRLPILASLHLKSDPATGTVTLTATDLDIHITVSVEARDASRPLDILIPYTRLRAIAQHARQPISLTRKDAQLVMGCDLLTVRINRTAEPEDFPIMDGPRIPDTVHMTEGDLHRLLHLARHCISAEETRYYLNGIFLHPHPETGTLRAVATDGHRLAVIDSAVQAQGVAPAIIPRAAIDAIRHAVRAGGNRPVTYEIGGYRFRVTCGAITIIGKVIDGIYPDYQRVIPKAQRDNRCTLSREAMRRLSAIFTSIAPGFGQCLKIDPQSHTMSLRGHETGEGATLPVTGHGDIVTGYNLRYLADQMRITPTARLEWADANSPATITGEDPDAFWVLMPMRF